MVDFWMNTFALTEIKMIIIILKVQTEGLKKLRTLLFFTVGENDQIRGQGAPNHPRQTCGICGQTLGKAHHSIHSDIKHQDESSVLRHGAKGRLGDGKAQTFLDYQRIRHASYPPTPIKLPKGDSSRNSTERNSSLCY